jgi:uncharacterized protein YbjT (DUF2867 family)
MSETTKPILVTGVTGQIGGELAKLLLAAKVPVRGLVRNPAKVGPALQGAQIARGDLEDADSLAAALKGADRAFFVGHASPRFGEVGARFFDAARSAGVRHVVVVSSGTTQIQPEPAIGRWHRELEEKLEASGLAWTSLRPGSFSSNVLQWAHLIKGSGKVFHPYPGSSSAPIDPRDIASVAFTALTTRGHEGKRYPLTGPELMTARQQVDLLATILGKPIEVIEVPEEAAKRGMIGAGMPEIMADAILELLRAESPFQTSTVKDVTGKEARTFEAWVRDHTAAFA